MGGTCPGGKLKQPGIRAGGALVGGEEEVPVLVLDQVAEPLNLGGVHARNDDDRGKEPAGFEIFGAGVTGVELEMTGTMAAGGAWSHFESSSELNWSPCCQTREASDVRCGTRPLPGMSNYFGIW